MRTCQMCPEELPEHCSNNRKFCDNCARVRRMERQRYFRGQVRVEPEVEMVCNREGYAIFVLSHHIDDGVAKKCIKKLRDDCKISDEENERKVQEWVNS